MKEKRKLFKKAKDNFLNLLGFKEIDSINFKGFELPKSKLILVDKDNAMVIGFKEEDPSFLFEVTGYKPEYKVEKYYLGEDYFITKQEELKRDIVVQANYINIFRQVVDILGDSKDEILYSIGGGFYLFMESESVWCLIMAFIKSFDNIIEEEYNNFQNLHNFLNDKLYEEYVISLINQNKKIIVFVEGETDEKYINKALRLLKPNLLDKFEIKWVGKAQTKGKNFNTGKKGLDYVKSVIQAHPELIDEKIVLLYDSDVNKEEGNIQEKLFIRCIPQINNRKASKGIENLFKDELITKEFYKTNEYVGDYGEKKIIEELDKMKLCNYICKTGNREFFEDFNLIITILEDILEKINKQ